MVEHDCHLLPSQFQGEHLVQQTECRGNDPTSSHTTNLHLETIKKKRMITNRAKNTSEQKATMYSVSLGLFHIHRWNLHSQSDEQK